jgi:putative ABC transport system ATP-binding protein
MPNRSLIRLENVWKIYQMGEVKVEALRGLSFEVKQGEFVAVQGPSGSGKSTAMNMIGALDYPTRGKVFLDGRDISQLSESQLAVVRGRKIGFIFQQFNLIGTLTALENVMLPMLFQGIPEDKRARRAAALLNRVELGDRFHHKPSELSGGQQQRVAIARSLSNDPEVILADEPTGNLDSKTGSLIMEFLSTLHSERKTVIMITHDEHLSRKAGRVEFIKDGVIVGDKRVKK